MEIADERKSVSGFEGEVVKVHSVGQIYISSASQLEELKRLCTRFQDIFKETTANEYREFSINDFVLVNNKLGEFLRAEIWDIIQECGDGGLLHVSFVDKADDNFVEMRDCVKLTDPELKNLPPLVLKYQLYISEEQKIQSSHQTESKLNESLKILLKKGDQVKIHLLAPVQAGSTAEAVIYKACSSKEDDITTSINDQLMQKDSVATPNDNQMETYLQNSQYKYCPPEEESNVNKAVTGYDPKDEMRVCRLFQRLGFCDRKFCMKDHERLDPGGWTKDKVDVYIGAFNVLDLDIPDGSDLVIEVTCQVELSDSRFYGHILNLEQPSSCYEDHGTLKQLEILMAGLVKKARLSKLEILPALGQILVVKHHENYLRARVVEFVEDDISAKLQVFCVDYGFEKTVAFENVWEVQPNLLHLPFQAVQFFTRNKGFVKINSGTKLDATFLGLDSELNVNIRVNEIQQ